MLIFSQPSHSEWQYRNLERILTTEEMILWSLGPLNLGWGGGWNSSTMMWDTDNVKWTGKIEEHDPQNASRHLSGFTEVYEGVWYWYVKPQTEKSWGLSHVTCMLFIYKQVFLKKGLPCLMFYLEKKKMWFFYNINWGVFAFEKWKIL